MRRLPVHVALLLLLLAGAVINIAIAWACIYRADRRRMGIAEAALIPAWPVPTPSHWPAPTYALVGRTAGVEALHQFAFRTEDFWDRPRFFVIFRYRVGWPAASLQAESWYEFGSNPDESFTHGHPTSVLRTGIGFGHEWKRLPLMPLWPGFLANTLLYAALLAGICFGPGAARRALRRRRSACIRCGYSLSGLPAGAACPECGAGP
jgi:hypothetical protein